MNTVLESVTANAGDFTHPLFEVRQGKTRGVILISSDKGLAGALNSNLLREAAKFDKATTSFVAAGRKGSQFLARTQRKLVAEFTYRDTPTFAEARAISKFAQDMFLKKEVDQVDIVFTQFINTLSQKPEVRTLLPIAEIKGFSGKLEGESAGEKLAVPTTEYIFEPSAAGVFESLVPHYLNYVVYQILLEAKASEHSARMVAMKNATDN